MIEDYLPNPSFIIALTKIADTISISSKGVCGGKYFKCPGLKEARLLEGKMD
jgi:hypothetical protein